jgi:hypothetical protein
MPDEPLDSGECFPEALYRERLRQPPHGIPANEDELQDEEVDHAEHS